jgi:hypothetical protein
VKLVTIPDFQGDNIVRSLVDLLVAFQIEVPSPPLARMLVLRELSGRPAVSRVGNQAVSSVNGIRLNSTDSLVFPALSPHSELNVESAFYHLDQIFIWPASQEVLSIGLIIES